MTSDRKENPAQHHSSARLSALERHNSVFESTGNSAKARNILPHHPNSDCSPYETRAKSVDLWVTELLNRLDRERDAFRFKPKSALVPLACKTPQLVQAKAADNRQADASELFIEAGREASSGSDDTGATVQSPTLSTQRVAPDRWRTAWPYALYSMAALTLMSGVAVFFELKLHRGATDTTNGQTAHSLMGPVPATHSAALRKVRAIPLSETAAVLPPNEIVQADASPSSALPLNGDLIEGATVVGNSAASLAALAPGSARMSLSQGQTVRIVAPPMPVTTDTRPTLDVTAHNAGDEEGVALDPSRRSVRVKAVPDASSYHAADSPAQDEPLDEAAKVKERPKAARPRRRAHIVGHSGKLRREAGPTLPHVVKADRLRRFALPALLRPTSH